MGWCQVCHANSTLRLHISAYLPIFRLCCEMNAKNALDSNHKIAYSALIDRRQLHFALVLSKFSKKAGDNWTDVVIYGNIVPVLYYSIALTIHNKIISRIQIGNIGEFWLLNSLRVIEKFNIADAMILCWHWMMRCNVHKGGVLKHLNGACTNAHMEYLMWIGHVIVWFVTKPQDWAMLKCLARSKLRLSWLDTVYLVRVEQTGEKCTQNCIITDYDGHGRSVFRLVMVSNHPTRILTRKPHIYVEQCHSVEQVLGVEIDVSFE